MRLLQEVIADHTYVFQAINILEFFVSMIFIIIPSRIKWKNYIICTYGGVFFGIIPLFCFFEDIVVACAGCGLLSLVLICVSYSLENYKIVPLAVVISKAILFLAITIFDDAFFRDEIFFWIICILISITISAIISRSRKFFLNKSNFLCDVFAILEMAGAILQLYNNDYISFEKDLDGGGVRESTSFFLYILKVNFWMFDYQSIFVILCVVISVPWLIYRLLLKKMCRGV